MSIYQEISSNQRRTVVLVFFFFTLVIFLIPITFIMHAFWKATEPNMKMTETIMFMKNIALTGAALAYLFVPEPWAFSLF